MRQAAILPILVTVRDILVEFLLAVSAAWEESYLFVGQCHSIMTGSERPEEFQQGERHLRALHKSRMQAIRILPFLEGILDKAEELLALELRGSYIVEHLLCFTKRFCRISSYRLGVTERETTLGCGVNGRDSPPVHVSAHTFGAWITILWGLTAGGIFFGIPCRDFETLAFFLFRSLTFSSSFNHIVYDCGVNIILLLSASLSPPFSARNCTFVVVDEIVLSVRSLNWFTHPG
ncbi:uncharacterized protein ARMOST_18023 [Armillaria ostoyae]|uniref:Uncharacterized protein n=1 Tax=Armillaria ostoyae TaxID=47428 RepID=A0A284S0L3_ARMOS|nr:uncharacterized protein ARMOST_18023 [Armillaria ostoyae]